MQKYIVTDTLTNKCILENVGASQVTKIIGTTNVKYLAERSLLFQKRYKIEFDGEDIEVESFTNYQTAYEKCKIFKVGDVVTLVQRVHKDSKDKKTVKEKVKILAKYPSLILVGRGKDFKIKESFAYIDIVNQGLFEIDKKGKKSAK